MIELAVIKKNIETIQKNIEAAAARSGRNSSDVTLMAVTKTKPAEVVSNLLEAGIRCFGENYPDETAEKIDAFRADPAARLAMIGHLQSRKAKIVANLFDEFHSLDRLEIAEKLEALCTEWNRNMPVMIECNVGNEDSKSGWHFTDESIPDNFLEDFEKISQMPHLDVKGLMILPPYAEEAEINRKYFIRTRKIAEYLNHHCGAHITELSMGTSSDYTAAVEEGATIVRIGTALVGPRDYSGKKLVVSS
ncbi:MAG: YggS family pyridoxal phosphate-dependent enzyme [Anaerolineaceae bacterium]|nr:YggS family pyridoxal phosphate-dependent enzyme [Anaerolineaceae bacterium]